MGNSGGEYGRELCEVDGARGSTKGSDEAWDEEERD